MRLLAAVLLLCLSVAPGCSCSQRGTFAGAHDGAPADARPADAGPHDGPRADGAAHDGGGDGGTCGEAWIWRLEPRVVAGVELIQGTPPRMGVGDRLAVRVWLSSDCEWLGRVDLVPMAVGACCADFWSVSAWAWTADGCEQMDGPNATWIVTIGGRDQANQEVVIGSPDSTGEPLLQYTREAYSGPDPPYRLCGPETPTGTKPEGAACATDCECAASLTCVGYYAGVTGAPTWTCQRPCNDLLDCGGDGACRDVVEGPARVCDTGDQCGSDAQCPTGFRCIPGDDHSFCLDERPFVTGQACSCDGVACPVGQRCVGEFGTTACEIPCQRDIDCPHGYSEIAFACGSAGLCIPLDYE
jgi:hypothetical protein